MKTEHGSWLIAFTLMTSAFGCNDTSNKSATQCDTDGGAHDSHADAGGSGGATAGGSASTGQGGSAATTKADAGKIGASASADEDAGSSSSTAIAASNLPASSLSAGGVGALELTRSDCVIDTEAGDISCDVPASAYHYQAVDQTSGGDRVGVFIAKSVRIAASASVTVKGALPLVLVASDTIEIFGELSAAGLHDNAVAGGSTTTSTGKGGGPGGGGPLLSYNAGGGGSFCGKGGTGNAITAGMSGVGGATYGTPELVPLLGGSAGGCGSQFGGGGAGGGAIQLVAGKAITIATTGTLHAGGGGGGGGGNNGCGGGSGGALLIEAPSVTIEGLLAVNGGGGNVYTGGPAGQDGQPSVTAAMGGSATAGQGSAGTQIDGQDGSSSSGSNNSSGGGGGGAGRIRINTKTGSATLKGTLSPAATTSCVSQGTLP
jgi:hypothetical protein